MASLRYLLLVRIMTSKWQSSLWRRVQTSILRAVTAGRQFSMPSTTTGMAQSACHSWILGAVSAGLPFSVLPTTSVSTVVCIPLWDNARKSRACLVSKSVSNFPRLCHRHLHIIRALKNPDRTFNGLFVSQVGRLLFCKQTKGACRESVSSWMWMLL